MSLNLGLHHAFSSSIPDGDDATQVRPSNWNEAHVAVGLDVHGQKVTTVADPTSQHDAANKNYVDAQSDGWDDVQGTVQQGNATAALTAETYSDTPFIAYFMRHDQDDTLHYSFQMPHSWDPTSEVRFHIHVVPMVNPASTQQTYFSGAYCWTTAGGAFPTNTSWTYFTASLSVGTTAALTQSIVSMFHTTPPSGAQESSFLNIMFMRKGSDNTNDTYTTSKSGGTAQANLCILGADVHFKKNKAGTPNPLPGEGIASSLALIHGQVAALTAQGTVTLSPTLINTPVNATAHYYIDETDNIVDIKGDTPTLVNPQLITFGVTPSVEKELHYIEQLTGDVSYISGTNEFWPPDLSDFSFAMVFKATQDDNNSQHFIYQWAGARNPQFKAFIPQTAGGPNTIVCGIDGYNMVYVPFTQNKWSVLFMGYADGVGFMARVDDGTIYTAANSAPFTMADGKYPPEFGKIVNYSGQPLVSGSIAEVFMSAETPTQEKWDIAYQQFVSRMGVQRYIPDTVNTVAHLYVTGSTVVDKFSHPIAVLNNDSPAITYAGSGMLEYINDMGGPNAPSYRTNVVTCSLPDYVSGSDYTIVSLVYAQNTQYAAEFPVRIVADGGTGCGWSTGFFGGLQKYNDVRSDDMGLYLNGGVWSIVIMGMAGGTLHVKVDNLPHVTSTVPGASSYRPGSNAKLYMGNGGPVGGFGWNGRICEVAVTNDTPSETLFNNIYNEIIARGFPMGQS